MNNEQYVCTGCSLLCDDITVEKENNKITRIDTACRKGVEHIKTYSSPLKCTIDGKSADIDAAIKEAADILKNAKNPLVFGHGNSTSEAQKKSIQLAQKLNCYIDDTSSFYDGPVIEAILQNKIKTCTLEDVRHNADVIIFWGADPSNSHPRHLSMYSYFPRGKNRQRGWEEDRTAIAIDVRKSDTAILCRDKFYQIPPGSDKELIEALILALNNKVPKTSFMDSKKILELANILKKSEFGVICAGLGLVYSVDDLSILFDLMEKLNKFHLMPMVEHYNMRGFNHNLFEATGKINRVKFNAQDIEHSPSQSIVELILNDQIDAILTVGSDPFADLPGFAVQKLVNLPIIMVSSYNNLTSAESKVTIPCTLSGVESSGTAIRLDGVSVELKQILQHDKYTDEQIINSIMEAL